MIPVTIIAGYLGAGKTTLINHLLQEDHGRRLAVLVNDFGAINVDADLIADHDGDTLRLTNGCVCCSVADALGDALNTALSLPEMPEQIVIEASGVADPGKVAMYGQGWPGVRLDAVVTVADGETVRGQAQDKFVGRLICRQLSAADIIIVNKTDLVDPQVRIGLTDWLGTTAPKVPVYETSHGQVPVDLLLERNTLTDPKDYASTDDAGEHVRFSTVTFADTKPFDRKRLSALMDAMPAALWRVKGYVHFADAPGQTYLLQRVGPRWRLETVAARRRELAPNHLALIFAAEAMETSAVLQGFAAALAG